MFSVRQLTPFKGYLQLPAQIHWLSVFVLNTFWLWALMILSANLESTWITISHIMPRHNIWISYSFNANLERIIKSHNQKVLNKNIPFQRIYQHNYSYQYNYTNFQFLWNFPYMIYSKFAVHEQLNYKLCLGIIWELVIRVLSKFAERIINAN